MKKINRNKLLAFLTWTLFVLVVVFINVFFIAAAITTYNGEGNVLESARVMETYLLIFLLVIFDCALAISCVMFKDIFGNDNKNI